jgi:hypothetical protein
MAVLPENVGTAIIDLHGNPFAKLLGLAEETQDLGLDATLIKIVLNCSKVQFNEIGGILTLLTNVSKALDLPLNKISVFGVDNGKWDDIEMVIIDAALLTKSDTI